MFITIPEIKQNVNKKIQGSSNKSRSVFGGRGYYQNNNNVYIIIIKIIIMFILLNLYSLCFAQIIQDDILHLLVNIEHILYCIPKEFHMQ